jgi:NodT family efflux transporter outer membrane factor (OMF) lipoprotein
MFRAARFLTGMTLTLAVGSCVSRPDLPEAPTSYAAVRALANGETGAIQAAPIPGWVDALGVDELARLVTEAGGANPQLGAARSRAQAARYRARGARGGLLPDLNLSFSSERHETPAPRPDDPDNRSRNDFGTSLISSTWEADVWGRLTARALAADLNADALEADLEAARLSVSGQTARAWVDLVAAQQLLALAREDLLTRNRALDLTQRRYERGLADALALRTARAQSASARANEAQAAESLRLAARGLQEVLGRYPDGALRAEAALPALPALSAAGAPQDLLERRPDVLASEARLRAAGFRTHEARAALLPRLTLTASAGAEGDSLRDITDVDSLVTSVIAGLTAPLFQGGRLRNEAYAASAEQREAAANYVSTALAAWREVEAAISNDASLEVRERELASAVEEAREAQALAEREYGRGVATIFELIDAYTRRIDSERALIAARAERMSNRIAYHVALGGGADRGGLQAPSPESNP